MAVETVFNNTEHRISLKGCGNFPAEEREKKLMEEKMVLRLMRVRENAVIPKQATEGSAG